ncbi:MAG TPA: selenocysteine-specific translation elongation factor [Gemmatimonadota bacterium]|nr:selenocysteine-specific translation elongation factor [Gemmatimonadota bacterium]
MSDRPSPDGDAVHRVVGTAGHIDHGKTALVAALTGIDTDRLPEERRRGISIDLGFAPLGLGPGAPPASVVDVPGHEGFVKNMVAGASGIDAVLFVVAADEGMMPQSREHLLVLEALGVERGVIAITKTDLVEPEWAELVAETVREELHGSALAEAPVILVSSRSGEGVEALRQALARVVAAAPRRHDDFPFRMPIDRAFGMTGVGTIVTGTVWSGELSEGEFVVGLPSQERARVRSVEVHGESVKSARPGRRAALGLAGGGHAFARGTTLVSPDRPWRAWMRVEVGVWLAPSAPRALRPRDRVRVHHGTTEAMGRLRWYDVRGVAPGGEGYALLELESPIVAAVGDRFVLRAYSPVETIGGGRVLALGGRRLRGAERVLRRESLAALDAAPAGDRLVRALELAGPVGIEALGLPIATGLGESELAAAAEAAGPRIEQRGRRWFAAAARERAMARVVTALEAFHAREPLQLGMPLEAARQAARAPAALAESAIEALERSGAVERRGAVLAVAGQRVELDVGDRRVVERAMARYDEAGLEPPETGALAAELGVDAGRLRELLRLLERQGRVVKLAGDWYADAGALAMAERMLVERLGREEGGADTSAFKEMFGVTRKYLIPILEYFDRRGLTRRDGNRRVLAGRP